MVEWRRRGAQELAPDLDRSAEPECRPHIDPRFAAISPMRPLRDAQHVADLSKLSEIGVVNRRPMSFISGSALTRSRKLRARELGNADMVFALAAASTPMLLPAVACSSSIVASWSRSGFARSYSIFAAEEAER
jgi:hypothetical protein